ncbi:Alpha 1,3 fucosyltransferase [Mortierella alpina]|nr:Alpha 1,3 fucosyltransferase [Mortierella alpina]
MAHWLDICSRRKLLVSLTAILVVSIATLQLYSDALYQHTLGAFKPAAKPTPIHFSTHQDAFDYTDPYDVNELCNNLPKQREHSQGLIITGKTPDDTLKVFVWRQLTYGDVELDWKNLSLTLCPFPPELQPFFNFMKERHVNDKTIVWEQGYAPCWFWTRDKLTGAVDTCGGTRNQKYISTQNYTQFRDADIIFMDYPFYNYIKEAPFWDMRRMPPRIAHQKWVFFYSRESVANYPHVALPSFLQEFDLTMGSPAPLFDIPYPLMVISEEAALQMANVEPQVPFDKKPDNYIAWVVSNCEPKNNRNAWMQELIDKIGAHSYGQCLHNKDFPASHKDTMFNKDSKVKILSGYPFTFVGENSNCIGYISEKIYNAFESGAIPVYLGAPDIADYVPEGSYINAQDFKNVDELVEFMKTVDRAPYYNWKAAVKRNVTEFCKSCIPPKGTVECALLDHATFF